MVNQRNAGVFATPPPDTLHGANTLDKPVVVDLGTSHDSILPQGHYQTTNSSQHGRKKFNMPRCPRTLSINPKSILIFCATLSCIGSIIVIYFALSVSKFNGKDSNSFHSDLHFH